MKYVDLSGKNEFVRLRTCTHISANYSAICKLIWFISGRLMHPHVIQILLNVQINILNSFDVNKHLVFLP